jgi:eukaryotic-like serine/threonine-protein kinase
MAGPAADGIVANRYTLLNRLGRGGMGLVWRARDEVLGREVAVKQVVFPPTLSDTERRSAQARVMREARAAARIDHPGVVTVYDVIEDQGAIFIVMELVRAPTLAELVRAGGPLPSERVAEIGTRVAGVLEAAHRAGIVHRDVTPGNVMVAGDGTVKLADFGIASLAGDPQLTSSGLVIGSPSYMAPEQAKGEPTGPPTDFWGLGATMYYAVEGEPPFDRATPMATLAAIANEEPRPMRRAGPLAPLLTALLSKKPSSRPPATAFSLVRRLLAPAEPAPRTRVLRPGGAGRAVPPPSAPAPGAARAPSTAPGPPPLPQRAPAAGPARPPPEAAGQTSKLVLPPVPPVRRRGRLLGVLVLLLVGGLLLAWLVSSIGAGAKDRAAAPTTTRGGGATVTRPATSGPAASSSAPSTTRGPATTQAPQSEPTAPQGGLPPGWHAFTNRAGSDRVGVPPGFRVRTMSTWHAVVVSEQRDPARVFTVRSTNPANPLPQASRDYRAWARRNLGGFRELRFAEHQTYAGRGGAVVFEYEALRDGRLVHVSHINFKGRTWGYNVEFTAPADQWSGSRELARQFEQAFTPLG